MEGAVKHFSYLWVASFVCAVTATGCGLVLDTKPRDNRADTGMGQQDGGQQDGDVLECVIDEECQNGNVCDGRETCVDGLCVGTDAIMNCADDFACTDDTCDPQLGCVFTPVDDRCTDDSICSTSMGCTTTYPCLGPDDCGAQAACRGLLCVNNFCQRGEPLVCPDNGCLVGGCFNGGCVYAPDSDRCNSGSPGNCGVSTCLPSGECSFPEPDDSLCNDDIDCTDDTCEGLTAFSCSNVPNHAFCDDGVECTYNFCSPDDPTAEDDRQRLRHAAQRLRSARSRAASTGACRPSACPAAAMTAWWSTSAATVASATSTRVSASSLRAATRAPT
jgi:hypothetical protein